MPGQGWERRNDSVSLPEYEITRFGSWMVI